MAAPKTVRQLALNKTSLGLFRAVGGRNLEAAAWSLTPVAVLVDWHTC
jgi:hypothetical protein